MWFSSTSRNLVGTSSVSNIETDIRVITEYYNLVSFTSNVHSCWLKTKGDLKQGKRGKMYQGDPLNSTGINNDQSDREFSVTKGWFWFWFFIIFWDA